jgi:transglutaminase-like putative cysteine protease
MVRQRITTIAGIALSTACLFSDTPGAAPSAKPEPPAPIRYQRGMVIKAEGGVFRNIVGTRTVPGDWPGQQVVRVVKEELPPGASVSYTTVEGVGRQMLVKIPALAAGKEARVAVTFEVQSLSNPPPVDPATLRLPDSAALDRKLSHYLAPSRFIESDDADVRKTAGEIAGGKSNAWEKVQTLHEWVKKNIKFAGSAGKERGAAQTLRTRTTGDDADPKCLTVALCRAQGIPARLVLIGRPGASDHCYFEFYLVDADGNGHWLAADATVEASLRPAKSVRSMILQKGDNVTIVDPQTKRRVKHRFLGDSLQGLPQARDARLQLQLISRVVD